MDHQERLQRIRDAHARYNRSAKGQARNRRYEASHPERKGRGWPALELTRKMRGGAAG
jgi:hypothetical protein